MVGVAVVSGVFLRRFSLALMLAALTVALSPVFIPVGPTKALPWQHMTNVISGVLLGPVWATVIAFVVGVVRNALGLGTIYAFPGGIPGAVLVGVGAYMLRRVGRSPEYAAFLEPLGTAVIGFLLALLIFAPLLGHFERWVAALSIIWLGWLASTLIGTIIGFTVLKVVKRAGILF